MLSGEYIHNVDSKGRITIPSKFRKVIGDKFVVTKGLDNCLFAYSKKEWEKFETKLASLSMMNKDARDLTRFFVGSAIECEIDKMGRLLLNASLRNHATIDKESVLVGVVDRIEIWNKEAWDKANAKTSKDMDSIVSRLDEIGLSL